MADDGDKGSGLKVLRKLGYIPYALACLSFLVISYKAAINLPDESLQSQLLNLTAGVLFASALIWGLVRLFQSWFTNRPARGLIDGIAAGIFTGFVGGYFGYAWRDIPVIFEYPDQPGLLNDRLGYVRNLLALAFSIPIGGLVGLGCDLIHSDRQLNWKKSFGVVLSVGLFFLFAVGALIFGSLPRVNGRGICFSDLLLLFEFFLLGYSGIVAISFDWKLLKYLSRAVWITVVVFFTRITTWLIQTSDDTSVWWAAKLGIVSDDATHVSFWQRIFSFDDDPEYAGTNEYFIAKIVMGLCLWTIGTYALFYRNHPLAVKLDNLFARWLSTLSAKRKAPPKAAAKKKRKPN